MNEDRHIKVTVIMGAYNGKTYIDECVQSILRQTLMELEFLCLDSGSTDGTKEILKQYQANDSRLKLINVRDCVGYKMNVGIKMAQGEMICIIDQDDYLEPNALAELYQVMQKNNLDVVRTGYLPFLEYAGEKISAYCPFANRRIHDFYYNKVFRPRDTMESFELDAGEFCWNAMYRTEFLREHNICVSEVNRVGVFDKGFYIKNFYYANRVMVIDKGYYHYRNTPQSTGKKSNILDDIVREYEYIFDFLRGKDDVKSIRTTYFKKLIRYMSDFKQIIWRPFFVQGVRDNIAKVRGLLLQAVQDGINEWDCTFDVSQRFEGITNTPEKFLLDVDRKAQMFRDQYLTWFELLRGLGKIVIFGAGFMGKLLYVFLKTNHVDVYAFCDNDTRKIGMHFDGCEILSPVLAANLQNAHFIIANDKCKNEMMDQLTHAGISKDKIQILRAPISMNACVFEI